MLSLKLRFPFFTKQDNDTKSLSSFLDKYKMIIDQLLESSTDGIRIVDKNFVIRKTNARYAALCSTPVDQIEGNHCSLFLNSGRCATEQCPLKQSKRPFPAELIEYEAHHEKSTYTVRVLPIRDKLRNVIGIIETFRDISQLKESQNKLKESEQKYQKLFESAADPILLVNLADNRIVEANGSASRLCGYPHTTLLDLTLDTLLAEIRHPSAPKTGNTLPGQNISYETMLRTANGQSVLVEVSGNLAHYPHNPLWQCIVRDISERRKSELAMKKLAIVTDRNPIGIVITRPDGSIEYANDTFVKSTGYEREELVNGNPRILKSGHHPAEFYTQLWETVTAGQVWKGNFLNRKKNGDLYWEKAVISPLLTKNSDIEYIIGMKEDITDQVRAEEALTESELKFRSLFQQAGDGIVLADSESGIIVEANNHFMHTLCSDAPQVIGNELRTFFHPPLSEANYHTALIAPLLESSGTTLEFEMRTATGNIICAEVSAGKIALRNTSIVQLIFRDITTRKQVERELENYRNHLENMVAERTKELLAAKEKAEESDRLKTSFLANMSHEIRTPLNGIIGFSQMLLNDDLDEQKKAMFHDIMSASADQLLSVINDILDISKIEAGVIEIDPAPFELTTLIEDIHKHFFHQAEETGIALTINHRTTETILHTDRSKVKQILFNLIDNAFKFTHQGSITLSWSIQNRQIAFTVADTGIGIASEHHELIFERFRQLDTSLSRAYGGNGLGLPIARALAEALGGKIEMSSEPGKGSVFTVILPLHADMNDQAPVLHPSNPDSYQLNGQTILLVEDEPANMRYLEAIFMPLGAIILKATTGPEAVSLAHATPALSLVMMDIRIPGLDGLSAGRQIKQQKPQLPIIIHSASSPRRVAGLDLQDMDAYIEKPYTRKQLLAVVERVLSRQAQNNEGTQLSEHREQ